MSALAEIVAITGTAVILFPAFRNLYHEHRRSRRIDAYSRWVREMGARWSRNELTESEIIEMARWTSQSLASQGRWDYRGGPWDPG